MNRIVLFVTALLVALGLFGVGGRQEAQAQEPDEHVIYLPIIVSSGGNGDPGDPGSDAPQPTVCGDNLCIPVLPTDAAVNTEPMRFKAPLVTTTEVPPGGTITIGDEVITLENGGYFVVGDLTLLGNDGVEILLPKAEIVFERGDSEFAGIETLRGRAELPFPGIAFGDAFVAKSTTMAEVGLDRGKNLDSLNAPLMPERHYLFFHLEREIEVGIRSPQDPANTNGSFTIGAGGTFILDPFDIFYYFKATTPTLGNYAVGRSQEGVIPFTPDVTYGIEGDVTGFSGHQYDGIENVGLFKLPFLLSGVALVNYGVDFCEPCPLHPPLMGIPPAERGEGLEGFVTPDRELGLNGSFNLSLPIDGTIEIKVEGHDLLDYSMNKATLVASYRHDENTVSAAYSGSMSGDPFQEYSLIQATGVVSGYGYIEGNIDPPDINNFYLVREGEFEIGPGSLVPDLVGIDEILSFQAWGLQRVALTHTHFAGKTSAQIHPDIFLDNEVEVETFFSYTDLDASFYRFDGDFSMPTIGLVADSETRIDAAGVLMDGLFNLDLNQGPLGQLGVPIPDNLKVLEVDGTLRSVKDGYFLEGTTTSDIVASGQGTVNAFFSTVNPLDSYLIIDGELAPPIAGIEADAFLSLDKTGLVLDGEFTISPTYLKDLSGLTLQPLKVTGTLRAQANGKFTLEGKVTSDLVIGSNADLTATLYTTNLTQSSLTITGQIASPIGDLDIGEASLTINKTGLVINGQIILSSKYLEDLSGITLQPLQVDGTLKAQPNGKFTLTGAVASDLVIGSDATIDATLYTTNLTQSSITIMGQIASPIGDLDIGEASLTINKNGLTINGQIILSSKYLKDLSGVTLQPLQVDGTLSIQTDGQFTLSGIATSDLVVGGNATIDATLYTTDPTQSSITIKGQIASPIEGVEVDADLVIDKTGLVMQGKFTITAAYLEDLSRVDLQPLQVDGTLRAQPNGEFRLTGAVTSDLVIGSNATIDALFNPYGNSYLKIDGQLAIPINGVTAYGVLTIDKQGAIINGQVVISSAYLESMSGIAGLPSLQVINATLRISLHDLNLEAGTAISDMIIGGSATVNGSFKISDPSGSNLNIQGQIDLPIAGIQGDGNLKIGYLALDMSGAFTVSRDFLRQLSGGVPFNNDLVIGSGSFRTESGGYRLKGNTSSNIHPDIGFGTVAVNAFLSTAHISNSNLKLTGSLSLGDVDLGSTTVTIQSTGISGSGSVGQNIYAGVKIGRVTGTVNVKLSAQGLTGTFSVTYNPEIGDNITFSGSIDFNPPEFCISLPVVGSTCIGLD